MLSANLSGPLKGLSACISFRSSGPWPGLRPSWEEAPPMLGTSQTRTGDGGTGHSAVQHSPAAKSAAATTAAAKATSEASAAAAAEGASETTAAAKSAAT